MPAKDDNDAKLRAEMLGTDDAPPLPQADEQVDLEAAIDAAEPEERLHPILTNAEFRAAQEKARKRVEEDARKEALKHVEQATYDEMRGKSGIRTGDPAKDELVSILLDLPEFTDRIVINGFAYLHANTYTIPRHVADSLREIQSRAWDHQYEIDGKSMRDRARAPRNTIFNARTGAVISGPMAMV